MAYTYLIDAKTDPTKKAKPFDILKYVIEGSHVEPGAPKYPSKNIKDTRMWLPNSNAPISLLPSSFQSSRSNEGKVTLGLTHNRLSVCLEFGVQDQFAELYIESRTLSRIKIAAVPQNDTRHTSKKRDHGHVHTNSRSYYVNLFFDIGSERLNDSRVVLRSAVMDKMTSDERHSFGALIKAIRIDFKMTCKREFIKDAMTLANFRSQRHETRQKNFHDSSRMGSDTQPQFPASQPFRPMGAYNYNDFQNQRREKSSDIYGGSCTCNRHNSILPREANTLGNLPQLPRASRVAEPYYPSNVYSTRRFPGNFHFPEFSPIPCNSYYDLYQWLNGNSGWNI